MIVPDGVTDNTAAFNALVKAATKGQKVILPVGRIRFLSAPDPIGLGILVEGSGSVGASDLGTTLVADYNEVDTEKGFLTWDGSARGYNGTGGGLRDVILIKPSGKTGSNAIKLTGADDKFRTGYWSGSRILVTIEHYTGQTAGLWQRAFLVDGLKQVTDGSMGIRNIIMHNFAGFGCLGNVMEFRNATHFAGHAIMVAQAGSPTPPVVLIDGLPGYNQQSQDFIMSIQCFGSIIVRHAKEVSLEGRTTFLRIEKPATRVIANMVCNDLFIDPSCTKISVKIV